MLGSVKPKRGGKQKAKKKATFTKQTTLGGFLRGYSNARTMLQASYIFLVSYTGLGLGLRVGGGTFEVPSGR